MVILGKVMKNTRLRGESWNHMQEISGHGYAESSCWHYAQAKHSAPDFDSSNPRNL